MKTILYYFTGTGNSLAVARAIVYPLYAMGLPNIVIRFFGILDLSDAGYVFSVVTEGGRYGSPTKQIAALAKQSGHDLDAAWWIQMPDNYIPLHSEKLQSWSKQFRNGARGTLTSPQPENSSER